MHFNEIFFTYYRPGDKTQFLRPEVAVVFAHKIAGILQSELDFEVFIPL